MAAVRWIRPAHDATQSPIRTSCALGASQEGPGGPARLKAQLRARHRQGEAADLTPFDRAAPGPLQCSPSTCGFDLEDVAGRPERPLNDAVRRRERRPVTAPNPRPVQPAARIPRVLHRPPPSLT